MSLRKLQCGYLRNCYIYSLFTAAASSIKVKIHNDSSDESDSDEGPDLVSSEFIVIQL